jgi:cell division cycle 20-like protein 1 (cofactor of APC complex)
LAVGTNSGLVQIWDANNCKLIRTMKGHTGRVGALAWSQNVLSSGSKDKSILSRDLRIKDDSFATSLHHKQEVCGLKWSYDDQQLASGGNDNKLCLWSMHNHAEPVGKFTSHVAAVKALTWSPH